MDEQFDTLLTILNLGSVPVCLIDVKFLSFKIRNAARYLEKSPQGGGVFLPSFLIASIRAWILMVKMKNSSREISIA